MTLLLNHLEQISSSARTIGELPFPPPKIFTNAILGNHEITTLIRDTEPHERALFSIDPNARILPTQRRSNRRTTTFISDENRAPTSFNAIPRKHSVARVLGPDMLQEIEGYRGNATKRKPGSAGAVDIEMLLRGAEKLCAVYPVAGASEKIASLRKRYKEVAESVAIYEAKVTSQTAQLDRVNKTTDNDLNHEEGEDRVASVEAHRASVTINDDDLRAEEQEIRELEQKKLVLEERVASMEKDLGGLLR